MRTLACFFIFMLLSSALFSQRKQRPDLQLLVTPCKGASLSQKLVDSLTQKNRQININFDPENITKIRADLEKWTRDLFKPKRYQYTIHLRHNSSKFLICKCAVEEQDPGKLVTDILGTFITSSRGNSSKTFQNMNELNTFLHTPLYLFNDSLVLKMPFLKREDTLLLKTEQKTITLPLTSKGYILSNIMFSDYPNTGYFELKNPDNPRHQAKGQLFFIPDSIKKSVLNLAETLKNEQQWDKETKKLLLAGEAAVLLNTSSIDLEDMSAWLKQNKIEFK